MKLKIFFFIFFIYNLYSKEILELSIDKAIELALKNNLDLKSELSLQKDKTLNLIANVNKLFPTSNFTSTLSSSKNLSDSNSTYNNSLSIGFDVTLALNTKMVFDTYQTILDFSEGKISVEKAKKELRKNVEKSYFSIIVYQEKIKIKEFEIATAKDKYNLILPAYQKGEASEIEKLNAELLYKKLLPELIKMQNDLKYQKNLFKILIGLDEKSEISLIDQIPELSNIKVEKLLDIKYENSLDYKLLLMQIKKERNNLNLSIANLTPTFKIGYSISSSFLKDPYLDTWFKSEDDWTHKQYFTLSLSIPIDPILPFSTKQIDLFKYGSKLERLNFALFQKTSLAKNEINYKVEKIKEILETLNSLKFNVDIAEKAYKLTEKDYFMGQKTSIELRESEKNLLEAKLSYLNSRYELYSYLIDLENISNIDIKNFFK